MAIFDIFEEVSEKTVLKTDTGDNRIFGVVVGEVVKNYDDNFPGRICVQVHTRDEDANELKWARMAMPSGGSEWGHYFLPEIGDQVLVVFEEGIIDRPYVIGCVQKTSDKFLSKRDQNQIFHIFQKIVNSPCFVTIFITHCFYNIYTLQTIQKIAKKCGFWRFFAQ